jgi:DNA-binding MarR family transcriptional regulator
LERDGLIRSRPGADKRIRIVSVTNKGHKLVEDAEPAGRGVEPLLPQE